VFRTRHESVSCHLLFRHESVSCHLLPFVIVDRARAEMFGSDWICLVWLGRLGVGTLYVVFSLFLVLGEARATVYILE